MRSDAFSRIAAIERATGRRVGAARAAEEPLRFTARSSLAFAATDAEAPDDATLAVSFLGLTGADGALPPYMSEEIAHEDPDRAVRGALIAPFQHRAIALLFRSVHRCRVPDASHAWGDPWPSRLAALSRGPRTRDALDDEVAVAVAPALYGVPSAARLRHALRLVSERWLDAAPIVLRERTGKRAPIDPDARARLGSTRLGDTAVLGASVEDVTSHATIEIGPVAPRVAASLLDETPARRALRLVTRWLGDAATRLDVIVRTSDTPARVGRAVLGGAHLGTRAGHARARRIDLDATRGGHDREEL